MWLPTSANEPTLTLRPGKGAHVRPTQKVQAILELADIEEAQERLDQRRREAQERLHDNTA